MMKIKTIPYKNHSIIVFEKSQIIELFGTDKIEFEITIVNDKLVLMSPPLRIGSPMKYTPHEMEVSTNA